MIPNQKRKKLDKKSRECVYLRHADDAKAYRLYNIEGKKIKVSRDVVFFETENADASKCDNLIPYFSENYDSVNMPENDEPIDVSEGEITQNETPIVASNEQQQLLNDNDDAANDTIIHSADDTTDELDETLVGADDERTDPTYATRAAIPNNVSPPRTRSNCIPSLLNLHVSFMACEPKTYQQAVASADCDKWIDAMREEYESLVKNETWKLVERPKDRNVIDNRWVFKIKENTDGLIERYKARLVARGYSQEYGFDYLETFSPVVRFTSIRIIISIAAQNRMELKQFDVKTAFLNGDLNEQIFMEQPVGLIGCVN